MAYKSDRAFTNYVHDNLAVPIIYNSIGWKPQNLNSVMSENVDISNAVDCFLIDTINQKIVTVQERFREFRYRFYNDFTIRYEREYNIHEERKKSEFFKLNADYFVYGIINSSKLDVRNASNFIKYAIIDINVLKKLFDEDKIIVDKNFKSTVCKKDNGKIVCPVCYNYDHSSSFIPVDIRYLVDLFLDSGVILTKVGF